MKSFLVIASLLIVASIACTANTSVGSQPVAKATTEPQPTVQVSSAGSQEKVPCTLTLAGGPDIKGLRLGMTADEALALFPGSKDDAEVKAQLSRPRGEFGISDFRIRPDKYESKDKFAGINHITFTLLDGRVSDFTMGYNGPEYSHVDKFVAKFIEGTSFPSVDQWAPYVGMDDNMKLLKCVDFEIRVFIGGQGGNLNYVLMKDLEAEKKLQERFKKAEEKATPRP